MLAEYDPWEHICGDAFDHPTKGLVAVVTAYIDAAYNHPKPESTTPAIHTVAAYIATRSHWNKFRKQWKIELAKKNLEYFHMTDFEFARSRAIAGEDIPRRNNFHGWQRKDFVPFQRRLHDVINKKNKKGHYFIEGAVSSLLKSDFDQTIPAELKGDVQCCSYYIFNVVTVMKAIRLWADRHNYHDPIHYIFASGDREAGNLERLFEDMWNNSVAPHGFRLSKGYSHLPYGIEQMKQEPALQAADILAYESYKANLEWIRRGFVDIPKDELRKSLSTLARTSHYGWVQTKEHLRQGFEDIIGHNTNKRIMRERQKQLDEEDEEANRV
jgi:hypothetical protein